MAKRMIGDWTETSGITASAAAAARRALPKMIEVLRILGNNRAMAQAVLDEALFRAVELPKRSKSYQRVYLASQFGINAVDQLPQHQCQDCEAERLREHRDALVALLADEQVPLYLPECRALQRSVDKINAELARLEREPQEKRR